MRMGRIKYYTSCYSCFIITVCLFTICGAAPLDCEASIDAAIHQCMTPVKRYAEVLTNSTKRAQSQSQLGGLATNGFGLPSNLGGEVFKELCGLIRRFDICVQTQRRTCPQHLTLRLMDASYGYLCNAGYQTFLNNADCLMELDQRAEAKQCHDKTMTNIQSLNEQAALPLIVKMERMCQALNFFASCVRGPIIAECRVESWQVIYRVLRDTTHVVMPTCPFESPPADTEAAIQPINGINDRPLVPATDNRIDNDLYNNNNNNQVQPNNNNQYNNQFPASGVDTNSIEDSGLFRTSAFPDPTISARAQSTGASPSLRPHTTVLLGTGILMSMSLIINYLI